MKKKKLIVVVGPTAIGKTAMGVALANHYDTEVISADSRQFYREMSIGTAKPDEFELAQARHHFIHSHSITEEYSAGDFERDALALLDNLFRKHDQVIVVGGSGLFVRALCEGLDDLPKAPVEVRDQLNRLFLEQGIEPLQARLKNVDPVYYEQADVQNPQRVIRALEVFEATGKPFSAFRAGKLEERPFDVITIGLNMDRTLLYDRINRRVDRMMETGLLQEVKSLKVYREKPALLTVGYAELFAYLDGQSTLEDAVDRIKQNSRRYAKRQITWFKKYGDTRWFEPTALNDIVAYIDAKTEGK
ncbi:tRNA (adenosine(37)-N6)-dimethylallyltransferase MiaA [Sphingobacterium suaedae]|uniref:tRNA dimethylallyltransferase n=1 Tax=Sphingobacterium suaedae TaxID=1686402 RepID=A0ABW5KLV7_9SPHI